MRHLLISLTFFGLVHGAWAETTPVWHSSYRLASELAKKDRKPLVVFVGSQPQGMGQAVQEGQLSKESAHILANHFVCVYLHPESPQHKDIIQQLDISRGYGMVFSDPSGAHQAFHQDGKIPQAELLTALKTHAPASEPTVIPSQDVGANDFETLVLKRSHRVPVIVDFWASWCGPCRALGPVLEHQVAQRKGRVFLAKVNADGERHLASQYGINSLPTVVAFYQGKVHTQFVGNQAETQIAAFLDRLESLSILDESK